MKRSRPVVGPALILVGTVHTALTAVLFPDAVRGLLRDGVVAAVAADPVEKPQRSLAFWFATAGVGIVAAGAVMTEMERTPVPLPATLPWVLSGLGAWGALQLPRSPFWAFLGLGALAQFRRSQQLPHRSPPTSACPPLGRTTGRPTRVSA